MNNQKIALYLSEFKQGNFNSYQMFFNEVLPIVRTMIQQVVKMPEVMGVNIQAVRNKMYANLDRLNNVDEVYSFVCTATTQSLLETKSVALDFSYFATQPDYDFPYEDVFKDDEGIVPDNILTNMELVNILKTEIAKLPKEYQMVMQCYYYEGMSIDQIAAALGTDRKSVKYIVRHLRETLKYYVAQDKNSVSADKTSIKNVSIFAAVLQQAAGMQIANVKIAAFSGALRAGAVAGAAAGTATATGAGAGAATATASAAKVGVATGANTGGAMATSSTIGAVGGGATVGSVGGGMAVGTVGTAAATGTAAAATGAVVGTSMAAKIGIAIAGVALVGGGGVAVYKMTEDKDPAPSDDGPAIETTIDPDTEYPGDLEITEETTEASTEEVVENARGMYEDYLATVIIPEYGYMGEEETVYIYDKYMSTGAPITDEATGVAGVIMEDLDLDGTDEMLVFHLGRNEFSDANKGDNYTRNLMFNLYDIENGAVVETGYDNSLCMTIEDIYCSYISFVTKKDAEGYPYVIVNHSGISVEVQETNISQTEVYKYIDGYMMLKAKYIVKNDAWDDFYSQQVFFNDGSPNEMYSKVVSYDIDGMTETPGTDNNVEYRDFITFFGDLGLTFYNDPTLIIERPYEYVSIDVGEDSGDVYTLAIADEYNFAVGEDCFSEGADSRVWGTIQIPYISWATEEFTNMEYTQYIYTNDYFGWRSLIQ